MRANKSKKRAKQTLRDVCSSKSKMDALKDINIFNTALMIKVIPQIIAKSLYSKLQTNVDYISDQNKYYLTTAIANLGNNKSEIEQLKRLDENSLDSVVMGTYRLVCFIAYKVLENNTDVLKKIFLAILIDNERVIAECNKFVSDDDAVIQLDEFDEDGNVIKTNQHLYIELMTLLGLFAPNQINVFKTAGYDVKEWAFFLSVFNLPFLYSMSGVLDTYLARAVDTEDLLDRVIAESPDKVKEILGKYKNSPIFV